MKVPYRGEDKGGGQVGMYLWKPCAPCNLQLRNCLLLNRLLPTYLGIVIITAQGHAHTS